MVSTGVATLIMDSAALLSWHSGLADATLAIIGVHIVGVVLRSFVYRQNLVLA